MPSRAPGSARKKAGDTDERAPRWSERGRGVREHRQAGPTAQREGERGRACGLTAAERVVSLGRVRAADEGWEAGPPSAQGQG